MQHLYAWEDLSRSETERQPDELLATKAELTRIGSTKPAARIDGLLSPWQKRDPITRRELLLTLFDKLAVSDGKIVE